MALIDAVHPKKILLINTFGIGDVLFTTPLIADLKAYDPSVQIGYVCNRRAMPVLETNPAIAELFIYERDEFVSVYKSSRVAFLKKWIRFIADIKKSRYDMAIDLSLNPAMGLVCVLSGIKKRVGYDYKGRGFLLSHKIALKGYKNRHVVEHYLDILRYIGVNGEEKRASVFLKNDDFSWVEGFFDKNSIQRSGKIVGIVPGGGASWGKDAGYKRLPASVYAKIADKIVEKFSAVIILMGDKNEMDLCDEVQRSMKYPSFYAAGKTTLRQFVGLAQKCSVVLVNDGGPLHLAVAAGVPTVSVFGPVDERVYGPYPKEPHSVVTAASACRPCYHNFRRAQCDHISCLQQITEDEIIRKVEKYL